MNHRNTLPAGLQSFLLIALIGTLGCTALNSFSESSGSVSSISESVSDSSTSSSGGDSAWFQIEEDVKQYTAREVVPAAKVDVDRPDHLRAYLRGIGEVCDRHAITHWEELPAVYRGIGAGLAEARVPEGDALRFAEAIVGADDARVATIREAYFAALR